jgi:hypothetical protein
MTNQVGNFVKFDTLDLTQILSGVSIRYRLLVERLHDGLIASVLVTLKLERLVVNLPTRDRLNRILLHFSKHSVSLSALFATTVRKRSAHATH